MEPKTPSHKINLKYLHIPWVNILENFLMAVYPNIAFMAKQINIFYMIPKKE